MAILTATFDNTYFFVPDEIYNDGTFTLNRFKAEHQLAVTFDNVDGLNITHNLGYKPNFWIDVDVIGPAIATVDSITETTIELTFGSDYSGTLYLS